MEGEGPNARWEVGGSSAEVSALRKEASAAAEVMRERFRMAANAFRSGGRNHGGAAAACLAEDGQRYRAKVSELNRRAARMAFRLKNPHLAVGPSDVQESSGEEERVLEVLALPTPASCKVPGELEIDLHHLRLTEALSILDSILEALEGRIITPAVAEPAQGHRPGQLQGGSRAFGKLRLVVGRGLHSGPNGPRLCPAVRQYFSKRGMGGGVDMAKGNGALIVDLPWAR
ncbi:unnamed protein product [Discosporangium mesarthrocarpum]